MCRVALFKRHLVPVLHLKVCSIYSTVGLIVCSPTELWNKIVRSFSWFSHFSPRPLSQFITLRLSTFDTSLPQKLLGTYKTAKRSLGRLSRFHIENDDDVKAIPHGSTVQDEVEGYLPSSSHNVKDRIVITENKENEVALAMGVESNDLQLQSLSPCAPSMVSRRTHNGT